jgi:hypothetical protein
MLPPTTRGRRPIAHLRELITLQSMAQEVKTKKINQDPVWIVEPEKDYVCSPVHPEQQLPKVSTHFTPANERDPYFCTSTSCALSPCSSLSLSLSLSLIALRLLLHEGNPYVWSICTRCYRVRIFLCVRLPQCVSANADVITDSHKRLTISIIFPSMNRCSGATPSITSKTARATANFHFACGLASRISLASPSAGEALHILVSGRRTTLCLRDTS